MSIDSPYLLEYAEACSRNLIASAFESGKVIMFKWPTTTNKVRAIKAKSKIFLNLELFFVKIKTKNKITKKDIVPKKIFIVIRLCYIN